VTLLLMVSSLVLNIIIRSAFYLESLNFIINYQTIGNSSLTIFYNLVSLLVNTIFITAFFGILYLCYRRKITVLIFVCFFLINAYIMMLMKASFQ
jgi:hypothetical protein